MSNEPRKYSAIYTADEFEAIVKDPEQAAAFFSERWETAQALKLNNWVKVEGNVDLQEHQFDLDVCFYCVEFIGIMDFFSATFSGAANFTEAIFSESVHFWGAMFSSSAHFIGAAFSSKADFDEATFSGEVNFINASFFGKATFINTLFSGYADFNGIRANGTTELDFSGALIEKSIEITSKPSENIIQKLILDKIEVRKDAVITIRYVYINQLRIADTTNNGKLIFDKIKPTSDAPYSYIHIGPNTDLGQAEFSNVDFKEYEHIALVSSQLRRSTFMGGYIPFKDSDVKAKVHTGYTIEADQTITYPATQNPNGMRLLYEQLTYAMKQQGDHYHHIQYYRAYQHWLAKYLQQSGKSWWSATRWSLRWHRISSVYGTNWWRGAGFTLAVAFVGYCLLVLLSCRFTCNIPSKMECKEHIEAFMHLFSPFNAHKFILADEDSSVATLVFGTLVQVLVQIGIAFGVYQTIAAFRSSGKTQG